MRTTQIGRRRARELKVTAAWSALLARRDVEKMVVATAAAVSVCMYVRTSRNVITTMGQNVSNECSHASL